MQKWANPGDAKGTPTQVEMPKVHPHKSSIHSCKVQRILRIPPWMAQVDVIINPPLVVIFIVKPLRDDVSLGEPSPAGAKRPWVMASKLHYLRLGKLFCF